MNPGSWCGFLSCVGGSCGFLACNGPPEESPASARLREAQHALRGVRARHRRELAAAEQRVQDALSVSLSAHPIEAHQ